jgi:site-specific DNA recombinase
MVVKHEDDNCAAFGATDTPDPTPEKDNLHMTTSPQTPKRAVLYARVSTDEQARSGYSMTQQLEALRAYAEAEGHEIVEKISDPGESGAYLERPGLDRVRDLVAQGAVDVVLAQDRDRFAREPAYLYLLQEEFAKHGTKLRALNTRSDDTPEGQLTEGMLDQLAKFERAKLAERTRRGRLEKARRGGLKVGRIAKYGFKVNESRDGYLIDEKTMPTAERIIRAVAAGESLYGVTKMLEAEGIQTPNGSKNWNRIFIRNLIRDDAYLPHTHDEIKALGVAPDVAAKLNPTGFFGIVWHNRTQAKIVEKIKVGPEKYRYKRKYLERPRKDWIAVPIPAPPGLDRDTVERARAQISGNVRPAASGARVWELSGGLLFCGHCGRRMRGHNAQTRGNGGIKRPVFYYVCPRKIHENFAACENRYHRAEPLEEYVMTAVSALLEDPTDLLADIDERIEAEAGKAHDPRQELAALERQLDALTSKRSRYLDLYADGVIETKAELGEKLASIDGEAKALEAAKATALDRSDHIEKWSEQKRTVLMLYAAFAAQAPWYLDPEHRRAMYERIGLRVTVNKEGSPEIDITLDPNALPTSDDAAEAFNAAWAKAMESETFVSMEGIPSVPEVSTSGC